MSIEKGLYAAPQGITPEAQGIAIEIEDPESVAIHTDGMDIILEPEEETADDFDANLADFIDDNILASLASDLLGDFQDDENSRKDWINTYVDGLQLLGLKLEDRTEPWPGACAVFHPLLTESIVKFQAETITETFPAAGPVKTQIIGKQTKEKNEAAARVKEDMNYQLTEKMPEFRPEHEKMLWGLGLAGNAFKKIYFDPSLGRQVSIFVPAEDIVVPYGASSLATSPRVTHIMRKTENEIRKLQVAGFYCDVDLGEPSHVIEEVEKKIAEKMGFSATMDDRYRLLEIQVDRDLEGFEDVDKDGNMTGIALPYVVTIESGSSTVLAIRRNWKEDDKTKQKRQHFVHYGYVPSFGFYCLGLIHLIGGAAKSATSLTRQLVDAGTLSNLPGGYKTRGLRIKGDDTPVSPGEFRDVDVPSGALRDNVMPLPYKEPSQVLNVLKGDIVEDGRRLAGMADLALADMSANSPVGTTLAVLERSLKIMGAIQARIHVSMRQEFKLLSTIIKDYAPEDYAFEPEDGDRKARRADYDMVEVIPVSDPNAATMSQKVVQYQAVKQMSQANPQIYDLPELDRQMLEVLGIKNIHKLIPSTEDQKPKDPVSENMDLLNGKPVKAFLNQDHDAHITVVQSFMQDPTTAQLIGQNPQGQAIMAAALAHLNEHAAFKYRKQIEEQLGVPLPAMGEPLPEDVEVEVSRLMATAATQLNQKNQAAMAQQQAQQQQQDPLIQMQQQELQIKQQEAQIKAKKTDADIELDRAKLEIDKERIASQERIAGANLGHQINVAQHKEQLSEQQLQAETLLKGHKQGADIAHNQQQIAVQREQVQAQKQQPKGEK